MTGRAIAWAAVVLAVAMLVACAWNGALAHDHSRPELNNWFKGLSSKRGPCCDGSDYKRVDDPDWERAQTGYRVRYKGQWLDVPPEAVLNEPNKMGFPMVWPVEWPGQPVFIRCFMPGSMG